MRRTLSTRCTERSSPPLRSDSRQRSTGWPNGRTTTSPISLYQLMPYSNPPKASDKAILSVPFSFHSALDSAYLSSPFPRTQQACRLLCRRYLRPSTDDRALFDLETFFSTRTDTLIVNMRKCKTVSLDDIRSNGFELLGSMIGSSDARRVFLKRKIDAELVKLATLKPLPHHHAHLLLSSCFQQDLRHLQRSLRTDDIIDVWDRLDSGLWDGSKEDQGSSVCGQRGRG